MQPNQPTLPSPTQVDAILGSRASDDAGSALRAAGSVAAFSDGAPATLDDRNKVGGVGWGGSRSPRGRRQPLEGLKA